MTFNLLTDHWIAVICADGSRRKIAPWELATDLVPIDLDIPRPDFRGAMLEFLIGIMQTAIPPHTSAQWEEWLDTPPDPETIQSALAPLAPLFNVFGSGPRFMQDLTLCRNEVKEASSVNDLLIEAPPGNFFVKHGQVPAMCPGCAAMALFTMQTYAPSGGRGHRTSLRGGGPLTTIIKGKNLWQTIFSNVRPLNSKESSPLPEKELWGNIFPWIVSTPTSENKNSEVHPKKESILQAHWGMPRRIVLLPETSDSDCRCDICGDICRTVVRHYITKNCGINYGDTWKHPLSPYRSQGPDKPTLPIKGMSDGTRYMHWLGMIYGAEQNGKGVTPARNIRHFVSKYDEEEAPTVLAFGYAMDNMKPLMWCEGEYPVYPLSDPELVDEFRTQITMCIAAADKTRNTLIDSLKKALFADEKRKLKSTQTLFEEVSRLFWSGTETHFYETAHSIASNIDADNELPGLRQSWANTLRHQAEHLFDSIADSGAGEANIRTMIRVQQFRHKLTAFVVSGNRKILELPKPEKRRTAS